MTNAQHKQEKSARGLKERLDYNQDFKLDWHDPDEAHDGYQLKWVGKSYARLEAGTEADTMIFPDSAHNSAAENQDSENLFFTGDNLQVLKHLQNCYKQAVKMIYIDPPYNTGSDGFLYPDKFEFSDEKLQSMLGLSDTEIKRLHILNGRSSHSAWLTFMYPRLKIAKELLREDGVIFISIDDNEQANLKLLCDEIFGEGNFRNTIAVKRGVKSLNSQFTEKGLKSLNIGFETILVYGRSENFSMFPVEKKKDSFSGMGAWQSFYNDVDRPTMRYDILGFTPEAGQWRWSKEKANDAVKNYKEYLEKYSSEMSLEEYWKKTGSKLKFIMRKSDGSGKNGGVYYWLSPSDSIIRTTNWTDISASETKRDLDIPFSHPKSVALLKTILAAANTGEKEDQPTIILDFFAGSGTTAHAVMELNKEDGGNRRYIMAQIDEPTPENSEARKTKYESIDQIARERIKRAAEKLGDTSGFKHYYVKEPQAETIDKITEFDPKNSRLIADDMVSEFACPQTKTSGEQTILTTWAAADGYKFTDAIESLDIDGYTAHYAGESLLYLIAKGWGAAQTKALLNLIGAHKVNISNIIVYGYSFGFESLRELETNLRQSLNKAVQIEKRY